MRQPIFSIEEMRKMIFGTDHLDAIAAVRKIWTDWMIFDDEMKINLSSMGDEIFKQFLNYKDTRDGWQYMLGLATIDYVDAMEPIYQILLESEDENSRGFAVDALARFSSQLPDYMIPTLWDLFENDDSLVVRINSLRALTLRHYRTKDEDLSNKMLEQLKTQDNSVVRNAIMYAIGEIGSMSIVPDLVHIMITRRTAMDKKISGIALDLIAKINGYNDREELIKNIN